MNESPLHSEGWQLVPSVLALERVVRLIEVFESVALGSHGLRGILEIEEIGELARSQELLELVGRHSRPVRGIFFDKLPDANWKVPWHQDVTIGVKERHEMEGYGPWSVKDGVIHVQPPREVLESMIAVRLHLDDCAEDNGALKVIPGSHHFGKLASAEIARLSAGPAAVCTARAGDAILMRPLLLHASSPAKDPRHRRVIHIEYSNAELPLPLVWAEQAFAPSGAI